MDIMNESVIRLKDMGILNKALSINDFDNRQLGTILTFANLLNDLE